MARLLSQTLIRTSSASNPFQTFKLSVSQQNPFSTQSEKAQLIEIDLESDSDVEVLGLTKLEVAIHSIIVRQSAPDWHPFVSGSSYWVPPRRHRHDSQGVVRLLRKFMKPLTDEESMALSSSRGWPSSAYFIEGNDVIENGKSIYSIPPRLKTFSDWLLTTMVAGNLEDIFLAATHDYASVVEEVMESSSNVGIIQEMK